ncbi:MAG: ribosomal protein S18-alanine N-acetyltransferase [Parasphingorhabdus sp.]|nr:ribosomal protein S18-alanine N-acetyltransferase [Parasphingorhabdus sp.]
MRPGSLADIDAIMTVMQNSFAPEYGEKWNEVQCRSMLAMPGCRLLIAYQHEEACGFAISRSVLDEQELLLIAVHRNHVRNGVGTALLNVMVSEAKAVGVITIFLEVRSENSAIELYRQFGFQQIGARSGYYTGPTGRKYDAVTLRKML